MQFDTERLNSAGGQIAMIARNKDLVPLAHILGERKLHRQARRIACRQTGDLAEGDKEDKKPGKTQAHKGTDPSLFTGVDRQE
jgi:hypothetical protein